MNTKNMIFLFLTAVPLICLAQIYIQKNAISIEFYIWSIKILTIRMDTKAHVTVNGKNVRKKKTKHRVKISPFIFATLGLKLFIQIEAASDVFAKALLQGFGLLLNNYGKLWVIDTNDPSVSLSLYGKFTIFKILSAILTNTKVIRKK